MACNSCSSCGSGRANIIFPDFVANSCCNPCCATSCNSCSNSCGCNSCNSCNGWNRSGCGCSGSGFGPDTSGLGSCSSCNACSDAYYARQYALTYCCTCCN